jgi:DNA-binding transcriptional LysR family regulator
VVVNTLRFPKLDAYHLIIFFYVANEKSITAAAESLSLSQPAVTNHIKSLEKSIHMKLIEVNRKRITLTPAGEGLAKYAQEIYRQVVQAERFVELIKESSISIGVSPLFVSTVAGAMNVLSQQWNSPLDLKVSSADAFSLVQAVIDSKIDLAIVPGLDYGTDKLSRIRISDGVKLVLYASPVHTIFKKLIIEWPDICSYPILTGPDISSTSKIINEKLAEEGVKATPHFGLTADNVDCCKILIQNGKSIGLALMEDIENEVNSRKLRPLSLPNDIWIGVDAVIHRGILTSPVIQNFISCAKATF